MKALLFALILLFNQANAQSKATEGPSSKRSKAIRISSEQMHKLLQDDSLKKEVLHKKLTPQEVNKLTPHDIDRIDQQRRKKSASGSPNISGIGNAKEAALLIFAVVGIVVILMWIPYFPILIYQAVRDRFEYNFINHFSLRSSSINSSDAFNDKRSGYMHGLNYGFYLSKRKSDPLLQLGLTTEFGSYNFDDENHRQQDRKNYHGGYYLIGPSMILAKSNKKIIDYDFFTKLDLLAGSSFSGDLGLLSKAEISFNLTYASGFTMGLGIGGLYIDVNEKKGILSNIDNVGLSLSSNIGYMF
jgi:hypothetical protein